MQDIIDNLKRQRDALNEAIRVLESVPAYQPVPRPVFVPYYWQSPWVYGQSGTGTGHVVTTSGSVSQASATANSAGHAFTSNEN